MEIKVKVEGRHGGVTGTGIMVNNRQIEITFEHRPERSLKGDIRENGDIEWGNGHVWMKETN